MFKKNKSLAIKGKTDEELEFELKKQAFRARLYFLVSAIVLIALVSAYKLVKNFQEKKSAEEASPENTTIEEPGNGEAIEPPFESQPSSQSSNEERYISPDDSSDESGPIIIEESDPGDDGPQEEIIEY